LNVEGRGFETTVFNIGKKFLFIREFAVPLGIHKPTGDQSLKGSRIAVDLGLIPQFHMCSSTRSWLSRESTCWAASVTEPTASRRQQPTVRIISGTLTDIPTWGERGKTVAVGNRPELQE
jgi:hypothetical protein